MNKEFGRYVLLTWCYFRFCCRLAAFDCVCRHTTGPTLPFGGRVCLAFEHARALSWRNAGVSTFFIFAWASCSDAIAVPWMGG